MHDIVTVTSRCRCTRDSSDERKGKEEYLYSAFIQRLVSMHSDMDHTVLPANYTMPALLS